MVKFWWHVSPGQSLLKRTTIHIFHVHNWSNGISRLLPGWNQYHFSFYLGSSCYPNIKLISNIWSIAFYYFLQIGLPFYSLFSYSRVGFDCRLTSVYFAGGLWWTSNWCSHLDIRNSRVGKIMASHNNDLELLLLAAHKLIICMIVFKLPGSAENSTTWRQLCVSANWRFDFRDINQRKST